MNSFTITNDGTIVFTHGVKSFTVDKSHVNYHKIVTAIRGRKFGVAERLVDQAGAVMKLSNKITVDGGQVLFNGKPVGGIVVERILKFVREGLPYKPLVKFLENLQLNPSHRSVEELYKFLEHRHMPITEKGHFIGYKAITNDWKDKHTRTVDNRVGKSPEMERNNVDDNFENGCSHGLHIGSYEYANSFASGDDRIVLVEVNPADAVSVPKDANFQKLRAWKYKVIEEVPRQSKPLQDETYGEVTPNDPDDFDDDSDICDECGYLCEDCDC